MNSLISTSILFSPGQEASFHSIKTTSKKLYDYIKEKGCKTYISTTPSNYDINQGALNLEFQVKGKPMDKKLGDKAIVQYQEMKSIVRGLQMGYYANQIAYSFADESILCHSMLFVSKNGGELTLRAVLDAAKSISEIFRDEFLE
jgi:hypothetical protein